MAKKHTISPKPLTYDLLEQLIKGGYTLEISDESQGLINHCRQYLDR